MTAAAEDKTVREINGEGRKENRELKSLEFFSNFQIIKFSNHPVFTGFCGKK
jgi:hypothetical protein